MAFGKGGARDETPVPAVEWAGVREFTIGTVERPVTKSRVRPVRGPRAIRVPKGAGNSRVFAPCAYTAPVAPPAPPSALEPCLFEDPEAQRLLCYLVAEEGEKGERHFWVHDDQGEKVGAIRRIPPSRKPFKHTWRIDQPGHPEVVGRNQWASGDAMRIAERGAGRVLSEMVSVAASMGYDGSEEPGKKSRRLEWRSGDELVMVSESIKQIGIKADWLDRRLAFAFAVLGDI